jgi:L-seryl-tRNA(Ser) seleniumtransferase
LLRIHPSNFRIVGFTESVPTPDLVKLGLEHGLTVIEDFGSGNLLPLGAFGLGTEPTVFESLASGVDVCLFSGDKLLGGPQAGLLVGHPETIEAMKQNPMARALRVDKLVYAALEATLSAYVRDRALEEIPVLRMIAETKASIARRARALVARIGSTSTGLRLDTAEEHSRVGGGAAPDAQIPTVAITVAKNGVSAEALLASLRRHRPPVIARISDDRVLLDLRTVALEEEATLEHALKSLADS